MSASLFPIGCIDWCRWLIFGNKRSTAVESNNSPLCTPSSLSSHSPPPLSKHHHRLHFSDFMLIMCQTPNVCLPLWCIPFHFVACVTCLLRQGAFTVLSGAWMCNVREAALELCWLTAMARRVWGEAKLSEEQERAVTSSVTQRTKLLNRCSCYFWDWEMRE